MPNAERRISKTVAFDVGCWTPARDLSEFDACHAEAFGVGGFGVFFSPQGRVAESGLRHSTRNRAWGNPPWVRIPPLPPFLVFHGEIALKRQRRFRSSSRSDKRGVNLISDALPFGGLWTSTIAFAYAQQREFYARRCAARGRRFARRQMDVDSRSAFAILSAASARNVAP